MEIHSIADFIVALKKISANQSQWFWYRGHADQAWKLLPAYQRLKRAPPESVLINKFKQNANLLLAHQPRSNFEWLFIMQHYGVPTRLLDWTESPLVALYFAVNSQDKKDGVVWILDPVKLNQTTKAKPLDYKFVPSFEDERIAGYDTLSVESSPELGIEPMAVMATRNNARIQAQLGVFTISHHAHKEIDKIGDAAHLTRCDISAKRKKEIKKELEILALGKFQIFPELASVGDITKAGLR